jgi:hypothetical protein
MLKRNKPKVKQLHHVNRRQSFTVAKVTASTNRLVVTVKKNFRHFRLFLLSQRHNRLGVKVAEIKFHS